MRNKDYQKVASFPMFKSGLAGKMGACCPSNNQIVPMPVSNGITGGLITISGTVVDEFGDILPGVHVFIPGQELQGTASDFDGNFTLQNVPSNAVVNFSYLSSITQIPAPQIKGVVVIKTALEGQEVVISVDKLKNNKTLKYVGFGLLAAIVLYGISKMGKDKKPVKASV